MARISLRHRTAKQMISAALPSFAIDYVRTCAMNIHTKLSLTIIAVVSVGATNAIAKTPKDRAKKPR
jgi:hypothetical protein